MQRSEPSRQPQSTATIKQSEASPNTGEAEGSRPFSDTATGTRSQRRTRLRVSLEPVLPDRVIEVISTGIRYGYDLRLRNGHRLSSADPLLEVFGVRIGALETAGRSPELQQPEFNPGRQVQLVSEHDHDGGQAVGVWDLDRQARAGRLAYESARLVLAATGQEVAYKGVILDENRNSGPEIRVSSRVLVYAEHSLALDFKRLKKYIGPASQRRKLLLVVEGSGRVQWWDYAGDLGPALLECLVPSLEVSKGQELLFKAARKLRRTSEKRKTGTGFVSWPNPEVGLTAGRNSCGCWSGTTSLPSTSWATPHLTCQIQSGRPTNSFRTAPKRMAADTDTHGANALGPAGESARTSPTTHAFDLRRRLGRKVYVANVKTTFDPSANEQAESRSCGLPNGTRRPGQAISLSVNVQ